MKKKKANRPDWSTHLDDHKSIVMRFNDEYDEMELQGTSREVVVEVGEVIQIIYIITMNKRKDQSI